MLKIWHRLFQSPSPRTPELTGEIDEIVVDLRPAATPYRICVKIELGPATADAEVVGTPVEKEGLKKNRNRKLLK
ncbi:unnamed protein product [Linum tenue]|uniref:Uncharacterized protein n=1 Tax=Linum tenue TaxID=586396 RepID=A0AAV0L228_9ROSI|nr:unnamed protein product [Linum tenue]